MAEERAVELTEADIPGASFSGRDLEKFKIAELKFWLRCPGATGLTKLKTKADYVKLVKAYIDNGWDSRIVDPDPQKRYTTQKLQLKGKCDEADKQCCTTGVIDDTWPKGPYTQQIEGVLPPIVTDSIIMSHLQKSGKQLKPRQIPNGQDAVNVNYSTLQRGHQYFMEGYIPGKHVMFCWKENAVYVKARCYRSQKKNDSMHILRIMLSCDAPYHVTAANCSCTAGKSGMCSHVVGVLKQLIHYVNMKMTVVPVDLSCTQMQQSWHKPRPCQISAEPVMNVTFCKAKQGQELKKDPINCSLYDARSFALREYNSHHQKQLHDNLMSDQPSCAFAQILTSTTTLPTVVTPVGAVPKGSILSYQTLEVEQLSKAPENTALHLPPLPLGLLDNTPCVYKIVDDHQKTVLDKLVMTLDQAHMLEQTTCQQSSCTKWHESRKGRVTASRFGEVLLRKSSPSSSFIDSFFETKDYSKLPVQISHGIQNETKARNSYTASTGFKVRCCGLVVNPSLPWLGASPDGLVHDPSEPSLGLLEVKCPYAHRLSAIEDAASDPNFFATLHEGKVTLKQSHKHYYQVQGQMGLACVPWCDFVIYTFKDISIERIRFDEEYWNGMQTQLTEFYFEYILPQSVAKY